MIGAALAFIVSPVGRLVAIGIAIFSVVAVIDRRATYRERARCESAALAAKLEAREIDLAAAEQAAREAAAARAESEAEASEAKVRIEDYEEVIRKRGAGACAPINDDDLQRVRGSAKRRPG